MIRALNIPAVANTCRKIDWLNSKLDRLAPLSFLALRLWVAWAFLKSGWLKFTSWDSTIYLFENEYAVPLLPAEVAAYLGTFVEVVFPVLLMAGLMGRFSALILLLFNIVAVISYPELEAAGARDHQVWGVMLLVLLTTGPGKLSIDHWLRNQRGA